MAELALTQDALLGGTVRFAQPADGYRAAIDPVLLAAIVPGDFKGCLVDLGCGAGAVSLCVAARVRDARITGVERDPALAAVAAENAKANAFVPRLQIIVGDVLHRAVAPESCDFALANPPYLDAAHGDPSPHGRRRAATVEGEAELGDWIAALLDAVRAKGTLALIQRADRLDAVLAPLAGRAGEIVVFPLWPRAGEAARRVIVRARKGVATPLRLAAGMVLHEGRGYTQAAQAVLNGASLTL